ncbi:MAG: hypothetical protein GXW96_03165 [Christensenellaceae bacterium]|nr:hypothetical protein [Christensenellaceae bacterium]
MDAPGKTFLKVVSILFIIFGAIAVIVSIIALIGATVAAALIPLAGILIVGTIILLVVSVLELVLGIVGLKKCGDPSQANFFIITGIILCVLALVSLIFSIAAGGFNVTSLIGFVLPILYIVGGSMNKKAASPSA